MTTIATKPLALVVKNGAVGYTVGRSSRMKEPTMEPIVIWDLDDDSNGNVAHIVEHDVTKEEVDEVLQNEDNETDTSASSGRPITFGWTSTGKHLAVVWEEVSDDPRMVYPVTAYETPPRG